MHAPIRQHTCAHCNKQFLTDNAYILCADDEDHTILAYFCSEKHRKEFVREKEMTAKPKLPRPLTDRQKAALKRLAKSEGFRELFSPELAKQLVKRGVAELTGRKWQRSEWNRKVVGATLWEVRLTTAGANALGVLGIATHDFKPGESVVWTTGTGNQTVLVTAVEPLRVEIDDVLTGKRWVTPHSLRRPTGMRSDL